MVNELAAARATCLVPLIDAPVDASLHVLEVTTPDDPEPLLVLAEPLLVSQLDHPNVVRVVDYGQEPDGLLYLAMDFLEGVELQEKLQRAGTLPLPRIVDIAMQVSGGLGHAHARGIIHRDIKPTNIVLVKSDDDEGVTVDLVKVCDFGIAARTGTSDLLGTPAYMSPEQAAGHEVDGRSDV